ETPWEYWPFVIGRDLAFSFEFDVVRVTFGIVGRAMQGALRPEELGPKRLPVILQPIRKCQSRRIVLWRSEHFGHEWPLAARHQEPPPVPGLAFVERLLLEEMLIGGQLWLGQWYRFA